MAETSSAPPSPISPVDSPMTGSRVSSKRASRSNLSLDLSAIPPLVQPSPPTNTLLITNLKDIEIFRPDHLEMFRDIIANSARLFSWSPLKSFARVVCSFETEEDAIRVRQDLDGEFLMGHRMKIYFGKHTPVTQVDQHLQAPESEKLFFISPPPSPPAGWESKVEDPPNTLVLAEDLAQALQKLSWNTAAVNEDQETVTLPHLVRRQRSGSSTVILEATSHGNAPTPGITVDDFSDDEGSPTEGSPMRIATPQPIVHTARPPVETMLDA